MSLYRLRRCKRPSFPAGTSAAGDAFRTLTGDATALRVSTCRLLKSEPTRRLASRQINHSEPKLSVPPNDWQRQRTLCPTAAGSVYVNSDRFIFPVDPDVSSTLGDVNSVCCMRD
jgi:hypothetical protein